MSETPDRPGMEIRTYREVEHGHAHDYHQILLPLEGKLDLEIAGDRGLAGGAAGAVIAGGDHHLFRCDTESRFLVLDLPEKSLQLLPRRFDSTGKLSGFFRMSSALSHLSRFAEDCLKDSSYAEIQATMLPLVSQTLQADGLTAVHHPVNRLSAICRVIDANLARPLTVSRMAELAEMSEDQLTRTFRTWLSCSPSEYLRKTRLSKAQQLITQTDLSLAQIAQKTGFSEQSSMTRCFQREQGITPGKLRKASRKRH